MPPMPPLDLGGRRRLIGLIGRLAAIALSIALIVLVALVATRPEVQSEFNHLIGGWFNATSNDAPAPQAETPAGPTASASPAAAQQPPPVASAALPPSVSDAMAQMPAASMAVAAVASPVTMPASAVASGTAKPESTRAAADRPELLGLVARAEGLVKQGDFASARLLLRRAAEARSAAAALALGATYDPSVLKKIGAVGTVPDTAQARQWYARAVDLGSSEAQRRLDAMAQ